MYDGKGSSDLSGIYRARVEYNMDPLILGRVRIRVPQLHGVPGPDSLGADELPWASMMASGESGDDYGSFIVPEVGSTVFVLFEGGDANKPVYLGSPVSRDSSSSKPYHDVGGGSGPSRYGGKSWSGTAGGIETPSDVQLNTSDSNYDVTKKVIYKSPKGSTILVEEEDGKEYISILDRSGQEFKMISPVASNSGNSSRRGTKSSTSGDQLPQDKLVGSKAVIIIKDIANQILRFCGEAMKEKIELMSRSKEKERNSGLVLSSASGSTKFELLSEDNDSGNRIRITGDTSSSSCLIEVGTSSERISLVEISASSGIKMSSRLDIEINSGSDIILNAVGSVVTNEGLPPISNPPSSFNEMWTDSKDESWVE